VARRSWWETANSLSKDACSSRANVKAYSRELRRKTHRKRERRVRAITIHEHKTAWPRIRPLKGGGGCRGLLSRNALELRGYADSTRARATCVYFFTYPLQWQQMLVSRTRPPFLEVPGTQPSNLFCRHCTKCTDLRRYRIQEEPRHISSCPIAATNHVRTR
jgi:hypothetical protein